MRMETPTKDEHRALQAVAAPAALPTEDGGGGAAISLSGLVKRFGATRALDGLDLAVRSGEVHGFLGPNGAGKTTTVRVLLGLLRKRRRRGHRARRGPVARRGRAAPTPGVRAGRGEPVAEPHRRRGDRPARQAARRPRSDAARRPARAVPARPDQEDPRLLEGQPAEGGARRGVRVGRRAVPPGRADLRSRPVDGDRLPGRRPRAARRGPNRPAVQPHPRRGRGAVRSRHDHPRRPSRRVGNVRRAASPDPHDRGRRDRRTDRRAERAARGARRERRRHACAVQRRHRRS